MVRSPTGRTCALPVLLATLVAAFAWAPTPASAQEIILDRPLSAGGLIFFPTVRDPDVYYWAPTRARLARGETGKPQFSFLRYVENVRDASQEVTEGEGGGIVHAVVQLGATEDEIEAARGQLRRSNPRARAEGPVIFRSGQFALVTSFTDENSELATRVVGLGTAPILEGGKAAISMQLTKLGAKVLHQSFQTATPDISFMFEMQMAGFREPKRAVITASLDQIYEHEAFSAGVATTYVQAEINTAFEDLREKKMIRLEQVGEDEQLESLVQAAYSKLTELIFRPAATNQAQQLAGLGGRKSALDRASELLDKRRRETRADNARIRAQNAAARAHASSLRASAAALAAAPADPPAQEGGGDASDGPPAGRDPRTARLMRNRAERDARHAGYVDASVGAGAPVEEQEEIPLPEFAAVVTYEMKRSRQRGEYRVDLNKWTADTIAVRFDENIGDLTRYLGDDQVFRDVNLDDPLYRQREVIASLPGRVSDADFEQLLTFVSLQLRKKHENGEESVEETRIDRKKFNELGNNFKLVYGWKGDDDRRRFQQYEYRTLWAFNSAPTVENEWQKTTFNAIELSPPFEKRTIQLEASDTDALEGAGVRSITVQLVSSLGDEEQMNQVTLNSSKGELSKTLDVVLPAGTTEYSYEIKWRLRGNKTVTTGRQTTDQDILYLDELPEA